MRPKGGSKKVKSESQELGEFLSELMDAPASPESRQELVTLIGDLAPGLKDEEKSWIKDVSEEMYGTLLTIARTAWSAKNKVATPTKIADDRGELTSENTRDSQSAVGVDAKQSQEHQGCTLDTQLWSESLERVAASGKSSESSQSDLIAALDQLGVRLGSISATAQAVVQAFVNSVVTATASNPNLFPTLESKKRFARGLQDALDCIGLSIVTKKGELARLDAYGAGGTKGGGFRLRISSDDVENLPLPFRPLVVSSKAFKTSDGE